MFETVVPQETGATGRQVRLLPVSIALHVVFVAAAIAHAIITINFPTESPRFVAAYLLSEPPPSPSPPPPPPAAKSLPQQPAITLPDIVAPTMIPDLIPAVLPEQTTRAPGDRIVEGVVGGIEGGNSSGTAGGEAGGAVGGVIGGVESSDTVVVARDESLPMSPTSQTYPIYPVQARGQGWEDTMVVRYTIGKDGRVRLVEMIVRPQRELFEREAIRAIRNWRFRPLIRDGEAKEVVHELTVNFELERMQQQRAREHRAKRRHR